METVFIFDAGHGGGGGSHDADAFGGGLQHASERGAARECFFFVTALDNDVCQCREGRVVQGAAEVDFFFVEGLVVLSGGALDGAGSFGVTAADGFGARRITVICKGNATKRCSAA